MMKRQYITTSFLLFSLLATMPAWGQTTVIKRTETKHNTKPARVGSRWKYKGEYVEGLAMV
jgi:hypothetical protein